jgi:hypothetical protein
VFGDGPAVAMIFAVAGVLCLQLDIRRIILYIVAIVVVIDKNLTFV